MMSYPIFSNCLLEFPDYCAHAYCCRKNCHVPRGGGLDSCVDGVGEEQQLKQEKLLVYQLMSHTLFSAIAY